MFASQPGPTMTRKVEKLWHLPSTTRSVARIGESTIWRAELVKEGVNHGFNSREALGWGVLEKSRDQLNRIGSRFAEYLDKD